MFFLDFAHHQCPVVFMACIFMCMNIYFSMSKSLLHLIVSTEICTSPPPVSGQEVLGSFFLLSRHEMKCGHVESPPSPHVQHSEYTGRLSGINVTRKY